MSQLFDVEEAVSSPLATKVRKLIVKAMADFNMIQDGDKVMVCVSGGKDSSVLLVLLNEIRRRAPYKFTVEAAILDQKQPGFQVEAFKSWIDGMGIPFHIIERDTYSIVTEKIQGGTYCSLCSRLRRAILYDFAFDNGFTKIALGHHRDDLMQTTLLNLFYTGKTASMPPKLLSDDKRNILLRPMAYVAEKDLISLSEAWKFPIIPCNLCGSQDGLKRKRMKALIQQLETEIPDLSQSMLSAMGNIQISQMLDRDIFGFENLETKRVLTLSNDENISTEISK